MIAVDTNLVVRYLTGDDPVQAGQAKAAIDGEDVLIVMTVILETEWVLRSVYGYESQEVAKALRSFAGLPRVTIEEAAVVAQALDWMEGGLDFADALHLAKSHGCEAFVSFDRRLVRPAKKLGTVQVRTP
jgi:predicted nucleic-acid-binding protein